MRESLRMRHWMHSMLELSFSEVPSAWYRPTQKLKEFVDICMDI